MSFALLAIIPAHAMPGHLHLHDNSEYNSVITPDENLECALYGAHRMHHAGTGYVYDANSSKKKLIFAGYFWTCNCGDYIITEGDPSVPGGKILRYTAYGYGVNYGNGFGEVYVDPIYVYYTDSGRLEGYRFYTDL